jgi:hypothetical protein
MRPLTPNERKLLLWGGGAIAAVLLLTKTRAGSSIVNIAHSSDDDLDALASMLITETGFNRDRGEMAQIVFVALNRAKKWKVYPSDVVAPASTAPVQWNGGAAYARMFAAAPSQAKWQAARDFVAKVQNGTSGYSNAGKTAFIHPGGMPTPPCSDNRVSASTSSGTRCIPAWAVNGRVIGGAMFA